MSFLTKGIWEIRTSEIPFFRKITLNIVRVSILTIRGFIKNECALKASALTFYTLLSLIPIAALAFAVARGFGLEANLQASLMEFMEGKEAVAGKIIDFADNTLKNAKDGVIAGIGAVVLIYVTIRLLMQIEEAMNGIWGVVRKRPLLRRVSEYLSLVILCPLAIVISTGATVFASSRLSVFAEQIPQFSLSMNIALAYFSRLLPFLTTGLIFSFLYIFIPDTKVRIFSALSGGFAAGLVYDVVQSVYLAAQITVTKYNAIYGSFAAFPLFLIWMQVSWTIILFGAQFSFAIQNVRSYEGASLDTTVSRFSKLLHVLRITSFCAKLYDAGKRPPSDTEISQELEIPIRYTRSAIYELTSAHILLKTEYDGAEGFIPAVPPDRLTAGMVLRNLNAPVKSEIQEKDPFSEILLEAGTFPGCKNVNTPLKDISFSGKEFAKIQDQ